MAKVKKDVKPSVHVPMHPMMLPVIVILISAVLTYIIPAGTYERVTDETTGIEMIDPDSFAYIERTPTGPLELFQSLTLGLQKESAIIFYLLIIGGMFGIINGTGALNVTIANVLGRLKSKSWLLIPVLMTAFAAGSAFCGNFEEYLVFIPIVLACCITSGYDSLTAVGIVFMAATVGYGGSITNAFTVGRAQMIAGLPLFSGGGFRAALLCTLLIVSIAYVMWRANIIKKNPKLSGVYEYDREFNPDKHLNLSKIPKTTARQRITMVVFAAGMVAAVCGVIIKGFYIDELSAIFLIVGIVCGIIGGLTPKMICDTFMKGCSNMLLPCMIIGMTNAGIVLLQNANVMDTILYFFAYLLAQVPGALRAPAMFVIHDIFNVIVSSGSAQAAVTMPLMIPLADESGITRQTAVLAYQLGDAFTNILAPTGGEILAALSMCSIPYSKWVKYLLPLFIIWCIVGLVFIFAAVSIGF